MKVNTEHYRDSNGHNPKPSQSGLWMFMVVRSDGAGTMISKQGSYREALRAAKAEARTIGGAETIYPQP